MSKRLFVLLALALLAWPAAGQAGAICTLVAEAGSGRVLAEEGDCASRATPASTFKIPLALMGFDADILIDADTPTREWRAGEPDWAGDVWRRPTGPERWLRHSVVWYSQRITRELGAERFASLVAAFDYGNADVSGDPGQDNGLERAWLMSSLRISPREQVAFLRRFLARDLPVSPDAMAKTAAIVQSFPANDGWRVQGKTGTAFPRRPEGGFDMTRGFGWFVGWAERDGRRIVFARLRQDDGRAADGSAREGSAGDRARDALLAALPRLTAEKTP